MSLPYFPGEWIKGFPFSVVSEVLRCCNDSIKKHGRSISLPNFWVSLNRRINWKWCVNIKPNHMIFVLVFKPLELNSTLTNDSVSLQIPSLGPGVDIFAISFIVRWQVLTSRDGCWKSVIWRWNINMTKFNTGRGVFIVFHVKNQGGGDGGAWASCVKWVRIW